VVEIQQQLGGPVKRPHVYSCRLCNIVYRPKETESLQDDMRLHLTMNSHKIKYLVSDYRIHVENHYANPFILFWIQNFHFWSASNVD
jgi:hypothetical protein